MKKRRVLSHAIAALGGLVLAYLVWTEEAVDVGPEEVTLVDCEPAQLREVTLSLDGRTTELRLERQDEALTALFRVTRDDEPETRFVGSDAVERYLEQLAPLRARRSLGELSDTQRSELGLDPPEGHLTLVCGDDTHRYLLGEGPYGEGDRYAQREGSGTVVLLSSAHLLPLQSSSAQLMQRALHTFDWSEVESMTLTGFGRDMRLRQRHRRDVSRAEWVDASEPDRRNELYGNWFAGYARLRLQSYLPAGAEPGADLDEAAEVQLILRTEMFDDAGVSLGRMSLSRVMASPVAYYARSETTRGWVRLPASAAESFVENLRPVLGLEPEVRPPASSEPTPPAASGETEAPTSPD